MSSLAQTLHLAFQHHQAGNFPQAELLYRQVLQADPHNADALHLLGMIAHQAGRLDQAAQFMRQALRLCPEVALIHSNLGNVLKDQGKLDEAIEHYRQALRLQPDFADAHYNLGVSLQERGQHAEAIACYRQALQFKPHFPVALNNLGNALNTQGEFDEAVAFFEQALRLQPDYVEAYSNLGNARRGQGRLDEAEACYRRALQLKPDYADAHYNLANVLALQGRHDDAAARYRQFLLLKPDHAEGHYNLGDVLRQQGKLDDAVACYAQALRLRPDYAEAHNNLGIALMEQERFDEALACYRRVLELKPDSEMAVINLANVMRETSKYREALACYRQALELKPEFAGAHFNLSSLLLLLGEFAEGWREYEYRWDTPQFDKDRQLFPQPLWQGEPLPGGTILLLAEQGMGDMMQFVRFARLVKQRVGTVILKCPALLGRLLQSCAGVDRIITAEEPVPDFDVYAPLMSLPGIFEVTLQTIPADIPYLDSDATLSAGQIRMLEEGAGFKVGIVWQGDPKVKEPDRRRADRRRSLPLTQFEPLARIPGVRLFSLQKGFGSEQLQRLAGRFPIVDMASTCQNFSDTAAVMKKLDLVISVDTSPVHLAGALGVPVWVPLSMACCWRWLTQRDDSPWYPTARLFRQSTFGDWSGVFERMEQELRLRLSAKP